MENDSTPSPEKIEFTEKELQIIPLILEGKSTELIASQLGVSTRAVEYHLTDIYKKLGVCSRTEAVIKLVHLYKK
jgi:DNA-binding NarL/FixJ family response regulator